MSQMVVFAFKDEKGAEQMREELIRMQLRYVQELLRDTDLSLARIAKLAGFNYPECMLKLFRRKLGMTPSEYRRRVGGLALVRPHGRGVK